MVPKERELEMGVGTRIENMTDSQGRGQGTNHWQDRDADPDLEKEPRDIPNKQEKEARFTTMNIKPYLFQKQPPPQLRSVLLGLDYFTSGISFRAVRRPAKK